MRPLASLPILLPVQAAGRVLYRKRSQNQDARGSQSQREGHPDSHDAISHDEAEQVTGCQGNDEVGDEGKQHHDFHVHDAAQGVGERDLHAVAKLVDHHDGEKGWRVSPGRRCCP